MYNYLATFDRNLYTIKLIFFLPNREAEKDQANKANNYQNGRRQKLTNPTHYSTPRDVIPPSPHRLPKPKASWLRQVQETLESKKIPHQDSVKP